VRDGAVLVGSAMNFEPAEPAEAVTAFVTLRPGASIGEDELRQAVRTRLADYKVPKTVQVIDAIPMSPVGKVLRRALRDPLWSRPNQ
jgi:fatty-acyl-CoA synthase